MTASSKPSNTNSVFLNSAPNTKTKIKNDPNLAFVQIWIRMVCDFITDLERSNSSLQEWFFQHSSTFPIPALVKHQIEMRSTRKSIFSMAVLSAPPRIQMPLQQECKNWSCYPPILNIRYFIDSKTAYQLKLFLIICQNQNLGLTNSIT